MASLALPHRPFRGRRGSAFAPQRRKRISLLPQVLTLPSTCTDRRRVFPRGNKSVHSRTFLCEFTPCATKRRSQQQRAEGGNKGGKESAPGRAGKRRQVPAAPPGAHTRTTAGRGLPHAHPTPQPDPPWPCDEPRPTGAPPAPTFRSPYIATPGRVQEVGLVGGNARSGGRQAGGESLCPLRVDRQVGGVAPRGAEICGGPANKRSNSLTAERGETEAGPGGAFSRDRAASPTAFKTPRTTRSRPFASLPPIYIYRLPPLLAGSERRDGALHPLKARLQPSQRGRRRSVRSAAVLLPLLLLLLLL